MDCPRAWDIVTPANWQDWPYSPYFRFDYDLAKAFVANITCPIPIPILRRQRWCDCLSVEVFSIGHLIGDRHRLTMWVDCKKDPHVPRMATATDLPMPSMSVWDHCAPNLAMLHSSTFPKHGFEGPIILQYCNVTISNVSIVNRMVVVTVTVVVVVTRVGDRDCWL